jgi:hypothetical protein
VYGIHARACDRRPLNSCLPDAPKWRLSALRTNVRVNSPSPFPELRAGWAREAAIPESSRNSAESKLTAKKSAALKRAGRTASSSQVCRAECGAADQDPRSWQLWQTSLILNKSRTNL